MTDLGLSHQFEVEWVHRDKDGNLKEQGSEEIPLTEEQWQHLHHQVSRK